MKNIDKELKEALIKTHCGVNNRQMKWSDIFDTETDLIQAMFHDNVVVEGTSSRLCRGYAYIKSFRVFYDKNGKLTDKQLTQLKRLAPEIAYQIFCR